MFFFEVEEPSRLRIADIAVNLSKPTIYRMDTAWSQMLYHVRYANAENCYS